jgi:hypothetical protein
MSGVIPPSIHNLNACCLFKHRCNFYPSAHHRNHKSQNLGLLVPHFKYTYIHFSETSCGTYCEVGNFNQWCDCYACAKSNAPYRSYAFCSCTVYYNCRPNRLRDFVERCALMRNGIQPACMLAGLAACGRDRGGQVFRSFLQFLTLR